MHGLSLYVERHVLTEAQKSESQSEIDSTLDLDFAISDGMMDGSETNEENQRAHTDGARKAEVETNDLVKLIGRLVESLSVEERRGLIRQLRRDLDESVGRPPRGKSVLNNVISLLGDQREWRAAEVRERLEANNKAANPKSVYNALNYLERAGHLQRIGHGRYRVTGIGVGIQTSDDLGEGPLRSDSD